MLSKFVSFHARNRLVYNIQIKFRRNYKVCCEHFLTYAAKTKRLEKYLRMLPLIANDPFHNGRKRNILF